MTLHNNPFIQYSQPNICLSLLQTQGMQSDTTIQKGKCYFRVTEINPVFTECHSVEYQYLM